ncbi:MAG: VCBS repeat-containing protein [Planctomycetes bacterium]|nr:VCBS repeat-containing protein [Planctomycetota bacterium]
MFTRIPCLITLLALAATLAAQPNVTSLSPVRHDSDAPLNTNLTAGFSSAMANPSANAFRVRSNLRGWLPGALSGGGTNSLSFNPATDLLPGEEIEAVLTTGLQSQASTPLAAPHLWRFRAASAAGPGVFNSAQHATGCAAGWDLEFGDFDNDGDLDAVAIDNGLSYLLENDGTGAFTSSALSTTNYGAYHCALADVESDGDLDIIVVSSPMVTQGGTWSGQNLIYLNDGSGNFGSGVPFGTGSEYSNDVDVGDLDGDGDVDFVVANGAVSDAPNDIYLNDGNGNFTRKGFFYVSTSTTEVLDITWGVRLADFDNDGDLDVFNANFGFGPVQSWVYLNDGAANFYWINRVDLGATAVASAVAVADLNGDGHLDVALSHIGQPSASPPTWDRVTLLFNNGSGAFGSPLTLSMPESPYGLEPVDIDGDGDLDLAVGFEGANSYIMINPGNGQFSGSVTLGTPAHSMAFADVDGDGDLDAGTPDKICINGSNAPLLSVTANSGPVANAGVINVGYNATLASLNLQLSVTDANLDAVSVGAQITNIPTQGILISEFSHNLAPAPYTLSPTSGTFNQGGVTHHFTLTANDGSETTVFSFDIVVGAAPNNPPSIGVTSNSATVGNSSSLNVAYGATLASLNLAISISDPENDNVSLAGTVSNSAGTGILDSEFSSAAQASGYTLNPSSGTFNAGGTTHTVNLSANDGNGGIATFSFSIVVGAAPTPSMAVYESSVGGAPISNGANASGGRDFGSQLVTAGATAALTVVIYNGGNANLAVNGVSLSGAGAADFVLNTGTTASSVAPSGYTQFTVAFDPASAGSKTATVEIAHNDGSTTTPWTFQVTGVGTTPAPVALIVVREGGSVIANGAGASGNRNFGSLLVGGASAPVTITVENAGNANLTLGAPGLSGPGAGQFSLDTTGMLATVPAGQSTSFTVTYTAAAEGTFGAIVSFSHNDASTATPFSFGVTGSATSVTGGASGGGSGGGGGGCAAGSSSSLIGLLFLFMLAGLAATRRRGNRA